MAPIEVARSEDVREGDIFTTRIEDRPILLTRIEGTVYAVENRCAHLGWSLARARITGSTIRCPWHGSTYDVCTGENLDWVDSFAGIPTPRWTHPLIALGKQPAPLTTLAVVEKGGRVCILPD